MECNLAKPSRYKYVCTYLEKEGTHTFIHNTVWKMGQKEKSNLLIEEHRVHIPKVKWYRLRGSRYTSSIWKNLTQLYKANAISERDKGLKFKYIPYLTCIL